MTDGREIAGARHLASRLAAESLQSRTTLRTTDEHTVRALLPNLTVVKIGGSSILDRGPDAILPVIDQLAELAKQRQLLICAGEGARARHAYAIAQDLGLPTGMLATLGESVSEQNALIIGALLMTHGAVNVPIDLVPTLLNSGAPVVISGMPPFGWWEPPPPGPGRIPIHRTDVGAFLIAETFGASTVIYIKDRDALYTADPATRPDAEPIRQISARELKQRGPSTLPIEPAVIDMLLNARQVQRIQLISGLADQMLTRAVHGEPVGTLITVV